MSEDRNIKKRDVIEERQYSKWGEEFSISEYVEELQEIDKRVKADGYEDVFIEFEHEEKYCCGSCCEVTEEWITRTITGIIYETDEEMKTRLAKEEKRRIAKEKEKKEKDRVAKIKREEAKKQRIIEEREKELKLLAELKAKYEGGAK